MQLYGDLELAWMSADGRMRWRQLPYRAVLQLAASDQLAVASENTVFTALSSWVVGGCSRMALHAMGALECSYSKLCNWAA